jgi:hypothetical protein
MTAAKFFSRSEIEAIAVAVGVTDIGLTGSEIDPISPRRPDTQP